MTPHAAFAVLLILLGVTALLGPLLRYLIVGWEAKRRDIMNGFSTEARLSYFEMFQRDHKPPARDKVDDAFERLYIRWYGRRYFAAPALLLTLTGVIVVSLVVLSALDNRGFLANPLFDIPWPAIAALSGAFMWSVNDLVSRSRRLDFSPSDVWWANLRLTVAIPMGYAFAAVVTAGLAPFIAFALGAFPLATLNSMLRRLAVKSLNIDTASEESPDGILKLQGINRTVVERLFNEDISTVPQLAYCDPIHLTMRSNLTFNFVSDCMNQALAWMYFADAMDTLRPLGLRGAVEILHLVERLDATPAQPKPAPEQSDVEIIIDLDTDTIAVSGAGAHPPDYLGLAAPMARAASPDETADQAKARAALAAIAKALKQDTSTLEIALREIGEDPYTGFLRAVWNDTGTKARRRHSA
jgi:hypothetical protein